MMNNEYKKILTFGVISLLVGIAFVPSVISVENNSMLKDLKISNGYSEEIPDVGYDGPYKVKVTFYGFTRNYALKISRGFIEFLIRFGFIPWLPIPEIPYYSCIYFYAFSKDKTNGPVAHFYKGTFDGEVIRNETIYEPVNLKIQWFIGENDLGKWIDANGGVIEGACVFADVN